MPPGPRIDQTFRPQLVSRSTDVPNIDHVASFMLAEIIAGVSNIHALQINYSEHIRENRVPDCAITKMMFENQEYKTLVKRLEDLIVAVEAQRELTDTEWTRHLGVFQEKTIRAKAEGWRTRVAIQRKPREWIEGLWTKHFRKVRVWAISKPNSGNVYQQSPDLNSAATPQ